MKHNCIKCLYPVPGRSMFAYGDWGCWSCYPPKNDSEEDRCLQDYGHKVVSARCRVHHNNYTFGKQYVPEADTWVATVDKLADDHWEYTRKILIAGGGTEEVINLAGVCYKEAFKHGYKHGREGS